MSASVVLSGILPDALSTCVCGVSSAPDSATDRRPRKIMGLDVAATVVELP